MLMRRSLAADPTVSAAVIAAITAKRRGTNIAAPKRWIVDSGQWLERPSYQPQVNADQPEHLQCALALATDHYPLTLDGDCAARVGSSDESSRLGLVSQAESEP